MSRFHFVAGAVVIAALVAVASGVAGTGVTGASNRKLARLDAAALLARAPLPVGAVRSAAEPAGDRGVLRTPSLMPTANVVDEHAWWVVALNPTAVDAFVRRHRPAGSHLSFSGSQTAAGTGGLSQLDEGFSWPALRGRLRTRSLLIAIVPLPGGRSGVRVDGQDVWITPRPASERIPAGATRLTVTLRRAGELVAGPYTFATGRRTGRVRALINSLPSSQPGVQSCPADPGYDVRLTFTSSRGVNLAVVDSDPRGCQGVALTLRGRRQHPLTSEAFPGSGRSPRRPLLDQLDRALGLSLSRMLGPTLDPPRPCGGQCRAQGSGASVVSQPSR
jgi:hypothetical protein